MSGSSSDTPRHGLSVESTNHGLFGCEYGGLQVKHTIWRCFQENLYSCNLLSFEKHRLQLAKVLVSSFKVQKLESCHLIIGIYFMLSPSLCQPSRFLACTDSIQEYLIDNVPDIENSSGRIREYKFARFPEYEGCKPGRPLISSLR